MYSRIHIYIYIKVNCPRENADMLIYKLTRDKRVDIFQIAHARITRHGPNFIFFPGL